MYSRGILDWFKSLPETFGIDDDTVTAILRAEAEPSLSNIQAVEAAFSNHGTTAPIELMDNLYQRYYQSIKDNPYAVSGGMLSGFSDILPWVAIGVIALIVLSAPRNVELRKR